MKAKDKFMEVFDQLSDKARRAIIVNYPNDPMSLNVVAMEVKGNTPLGKKLLAEMGFTDI